VVLAGPLWSSVAPSHPIRRVDAHPGSRAPRSPGRSAGRPAHDMSTNQPTKVPTKPPTNLPNARGMLQCERPASQAVFRLARWPDPLPSSITRGHASVLTEAGGRKRMAMLTMARGEALAGERRANGPCLSGLDRHPLHIGRLVARTDTA
jgi:hypothetical protein